MLESVVAFIHKVLDPIGIIVGLLIAIPVFWTWYEVTLGRKRRHRIWFRQAAEDKGQRPAILIVDLLPGKEIETSVERYRKDDPALASVPADRIFRVSRTNAVGSDDMPDLAADIRNRAADVLRSGADSVHVFYAGPVVPAMLIGAELANTRRIILYQHSPSGYDNWGPLKYLDV